MFSCSRDSRNLLAIAVAVIAALFWLSDGSNASGLYLHRAALGD
jgi:hypothetical protein